MSPVCNRQVNRHQLAPDCASYGSLRPKLTRDQDHRVPAMIGLFQSGRGAERAACDARRRDNGDLRVSDSYYRSRSRHALAMAARRGIEDPDWPPHFSCGCAVDIRFVFGAVLRGFDLTPPIFEREILMPQRQVDVMDKAGAILHTYPITLGSDALKASDFEKAALKEAAKVRLVPEGDIAGLTARMHPFTIGATYATAPAMVKPSVRVKN